MKFSTSPLKKKVHKLFALFLTFSLISQSLVFTGLSKQKAFAAGLGSNTVLLIHSNDYPGSNYFSDSSDSMHTISSNGAIHSDTVIHDGFGTSTIEFGAANEDLTIPDSDDWSFGNDDFAIDFWIYFDGYSSVNTYTLFEQFKDASNNWSVGMNNNTMKFTVYDGGTETINIQHSWTPGDMTWHHFAMTRSSNSFRFFVDGALLGTEITDTDPMPNLAAPADLTFSSASSDFVGYMDEIRITKNDAIWTDGFTPPTEPYSSGTCPTGVCEVVPPTEKIVIDQFAPANSGDILIAEFELASSGGINILKSVEVEIMDANDLSLTSSDLNFLKLWRDGAVSGFEGDETQIAGGGSGCSAGFGMNILNNDCDTAPLSDPIDAGGTRYFITLSTGADWSDNLQAGSPPDAISINIYDIGIITDDESFINTSLYGYNKLSADTTGPQILGVNRVADQEFEIIFDESIDSINASDSANYSLYDGFSPQVITALNLQNDNKVVHINTDNAIGRDFNVIINSSIQDKLGNFTSDTYARYIDPAILISEIQTYGGGGYPSEDEFIELYNRNNSSISLIDYFLKDGDSNYIYTISTGDTLIPGNGFFLLANSNFDAITTDNYNGTKDQIFYGDLLIDTGGSITLFDGNGIIVDRVGYGTNARYFEGYPMSDPMSGESIERKASHDSDSYSMDNGGAHATLGNSFDSSINYDDFISRMTPDPQNTFSNPESFSGSDIIFVDPADEQYGVPVGLDPVYLAFANEMDSATINADNLYLTDGTNTTKIGSGNEAVVVYCPDTNLDSFCINGPGNLNYLAYISPPSGYLDYNNTYEVVVSKNTLDINGIPINGNRGDNYYHSFFYTEGEVGTSSPPFIEGSLPISGQFDVPTNTLVFAKFSEPIDQSSVIINSANDTVQLVKVVNPDTASEYEGAKVVISTQVNEASGLLKITTASLLEKDTRYRLKIFGNIKSLNGLEMDMDEYNNNLMWTSDFHTVNVAGSGSDLTSPTIDYVFPEDTSTDISTVPGVIQAFASEQLNIETINQNSVILKNYLTSVEIPRMVSYNPFSKVINIIPQEVLSPFTEYEILIKDTITDFTFPGNQLDGNGIDDNDHHTTFTTSEVINTSPPVITGAWADNYMVEVEFSALMNTQQNGINSVKNKDNIVLRENGTDVDLANANIFYDFQENRLIIDNLNLTSGNDFWISFYNGSNNFDYRFDFTDPAGAVQGINGIAIGDAEEFYHTASGTIGDSSKAENYAVAFPMNSMTGQETTYHFELPIFNTIPAGGKILLKFPNGFDISGAMQDAGSSSNEDFNGASAGFPQFDNTNGISVNSTINTIKVTLEDNPADVPNGCGSDNICSTDPAGFDYLTLDIAGIINTNVPKSWDTDGYQVEIQTRDNNGNIIENFIAEPFFIEESGTFSLSGQVLAVGANSGKVQVYLDSAITGPIEVTTGAFVAGRANYTFQDLPAGEYIIFTDPFITLPNDDYVGINPPEFIILENNISNYDLTLEPENTGVRTEFTVEITGPANAPLDIFVDSNENSIIKELTLDNSGNGIVKFFLPDNEWFIGVGPQMPKGISSDEMPDFNFLIPSSKIAQVLNPICEVDGIFECKATFNLKIPDKKLPGKVVNEANAPIANAKVFAHDPINGYEAFTQTDSNGDFELNLIAGKFKIGAITTGLPATKEVPVDILNNGTILVDGIQKNSVTLMIKSTDYFISGSVLDLDDKPVKNASIWANQTNKPGFVETMTDSMGKYKVYVNRGIWEVGAYIPQYGELREKTVTIVDSSKTGINFSLANTGETYHKISGNVSIGGSNVPNTSILAEVMINGRYRMFDTITNENGNYSINVIENDPLEGKYSIYAYNSKYGDFTPITNLNVNANIAGQDFTRSAPRSIRVEIRDSSDNLHKINNAFVDFYDPASSLGNIIHIQDASYGKLNLSDGDYEIYTNIPGIDSSNLELSVNNLAVDTLNVSGDSTLTITLPDMYNLSGTVIYNAVDMDDVWIEISNAGSGINYGVSSDENGNYDLNLPVGIYNIYAIKPGYFTAIETITVVDQDITKDLNLNKANLTIQGTVNANGESAPYAFVSARKIGEKVVLSTQADADGNYALPVGAGDWNLHAGADGFKNAAHPNNTFSISANQTGVDFNLTQTVNTKTPFNIPFIQSQGGMINAGNLGVLLTIPPNALGFSNSTGAITIIETSNLMRSSTSEPFGNLGKQITATDPNGNAVKNLNSPITVEMTYSKEEIAAIFTDLGITPTLEMVKSLKFSYWDETAGTWVELPTTIITNPRSATTYEELINNAEGFAVKIKATTTHLSIFSTVVSTVVTASATGTGSGGGNNSENSNNNGSSGGGSSLLAGLQESAKRLGNVIGTTGQSIKVASGLNLDEVVVIKRNGKTVSISNILNKAASGGGSSASNLVAFAVGDTISTTSKGAADIDLGGFTKMHLGKNSEVKIYNASKDKIQYRQNAGEIKYEFDKQGEEITFEVHTVNVNATIRGTIIVVRTMDNSEVYDLIKGEIEMHNKNTGEKYEIIAGQRFMIDENGEVSIAEFDIDSAEFSEFLTDEQKVQIKAERENILQTGFRDVNENDWFAPYAKKLYEMGIIQGRSGQLFAPADPITRAESLKITLLANEINVENYDRNYRFYDIHEEDWFANFISTAKKLGIIEGKTDGKFYPNDQISRAEALKIILETKEEEMNIEMNENCLFSDTQENDWFANYVCHANNAKIIQGYEGNLFKPNDPVTRAEFVKMISVANDLITNNTKDDSDGDEILNENTTENDLIYKDESDNLNEITSESKIEDFIGAPSVIYFGGTYCPHCTNEMPNLKTKIYDIYQDQINIWVNVIDGKNGAKFDIQDISQGYNENLKFNDIANQECAYIPSWLILNNDGELVTSSCGNEKTTDEMSEEIQKLLK